MHRDVAGVKSNFLLFSRLEAYTSVDSQNEISDNATTNQSAK